MLQSERYISYRSVELQVLEVLSSLARTSQTVSVTQYCNY